MKKLIFVLLAISIASTLHSQDIELSALPKKSIKETEKIINEFIKAINQGDEIESFFNSNEVNYGGAIWMKPVEFVNFIKSLFPIPANDVNLNYGTFDIVEMNESLKEKAIKLNRIFNNFSVIADGSINNKEVTFILQPENNQLKIKSITFWDIALVGNESVNLSNYDTISDLGMTILIPDKFEGPFREGEQINYFLKGETQRDAVIQIMYLPKTAPINLVTYSWVEYITSSYKRSPFEISYLSNGYIYRYEVIGDDKVINKGISVGIENDKYSIIIQYFAFKDTYNQH